MDRKLDYQDNDSQDILNPGQNDSLRSKKSSTKDGVLALVKGIASQIIVQLRLAAEFGIPYTQIFSQDYRGLSHKDIEKLIVRSLRSGDEGLAMLNQLGEDLLAHQIAVISGLDGIVRQTLETLDPDEIKKSKGVLNSKSKSWVAYTKAFTELNKNAIKRHQEVVIPGFVSAYVNARHNQERNPIKIDDTED